MKKLFGLLFVFVCSFALFACSKKTEDTNTKKEETAQTVVTPVEEGEKSTVDALISEEFFSLCKDKEVYATTCGQADLATLQVIIEDSLADLDMEDPTHYEPDYSASDIPNGAILFLVVGGSLKGLGAAGVDVESEAARATEFANKAKAGEITLIVVHIGGSARRGDTSDPIIKAAAPKANMLLVVETGNEDGYFTNVSKDNNIPLFLYSKQSKMKASIAKLFS